jgi:hypothetical protein
MFPSARSLVKISYGQNSISTLTTADTEFCCNVEAMEFNPTNSNKTEVAELTSYQTKRV